MNKEISYWNLFRHTFLLSAFTFGGGYVIVPLMKKRFVDDLNWLKDDEMMNLIALAQSAPGPIAVNSSIIVGYNLLGVSGALTAALGTVLPPLLIMTIVSYIYLAVRDNVLVQNVMRGMQAGIAAIIVNVVWKLVQGVLKTKNVRLIVVMLISLIAAIFFDVNVIYLLLFATVVALISHFMNTDSEVKS